MTTKKKKPRVDLQTEPTPLGETVGACTYQTPTMRAESPDSVLPGTLVRAGGNLAIQKPDGRFYTCYFDGTDLDNDQIFDQEQFLPGQGAEGGRLVLTADRMAYAEQMADQGGGKCYWISVVLQ